MKSKFIFISALQVLFTLLITGTTEAGIFSRNIDSIQIVLDENQLVLPGETFTVGIQAYGKKGNHVKSWTNEGGLFFGLKYDMEVTGGEKLTAGKIKVNPELAPSKGKYISIKVWPKKKPGLAQVVLVPLNYEVAVNFVPVSDFDKAPGCSFKAEINTVYNNGVTKQNRVNKSVFNKLSSQFDFWGISFEKGQFIIEPDFEKIYDHRVGLVFYAEQNSELAANFEVQLDYKHKYELSFYGMNGSDGFSGNSGMDGARGHRGGFGGGGQDGEPGYDGPELGIWTDV